MRSRVETLVRTFSFRRLLTSKAFVCSGLIIAVCFAIALYNYMKFSAMVDKTVNGKMFEQSAKIYGIAPESDRINPGIRPPGRVTQVSYQNGATTMKETPALITNFFDASRTRRRVIEFREIPERLVAAVLSGEDRAFFNHYGINPRRIAGAFLSNIKNRGPSQGASTITQQLARSLFLTREPTLKRKVSEAFIALILEHRLSKQQIFTMYANEIYLGNRDSFAIHGFAEAAKAYFGKELADLTLSESATLAGIIPAPNAYSPVHHPDRAKERRNLILRIMLNSGSITTREYEKAKEAKLTIAANVDPAEGHYLVDFVRDELLKEFSEEALMTGGMSVYTTVDPELQKAAVESVELGLTFVKAQFERKGRKASSPGDPEPQAGLIALDPRTGEIKAMVGGSHYGSSQYNRMTQAMRQPGSIFKPIVYAAALETSLEGFLQYDLNPNDEEMVQTPITPVTTIIDEPLIFHSGGPEKEYAPRNYDRQYRGVVTLRTAFYHSLNVPTVMLAQQIGYDRVARLARRLGLNSAIRGYPSIALGAFEVTPIEIAGAYTAFANGGRRAQPHAIREIVSDEGAVLKSYDYQSEQVLSPKIAYLITHLMEGAINFGTGGGVRARGFMLPAAGKTGTSRDGWFAGYTKELLVIAWVGFDDGRDLNLEGAKSALPIWAEFMKKAYKLYPPRSMGSLYFAPPYGIEFVRIDAATLLRGDPSCGESFEAAFVEGTAPTASCLDD